MPEPETILLRATSADFDLARRAVGEINLPTSHHPGPLDDDALTVFLADPRLYLLLAVREGKPVGSLYGYALQSPHRREAQFLLYGIDVRPECSGQGIGTALVAGFIEEARRAGACEVWVLTAETNAAAMRMYTRCGMKRAGAADVMLTLELGGRAGPEAREPSTG